jgi:hypothetical protein
MFYGSDMWYDMVIRSSGKCVWTLVQNIFHTRSVGISGIGVGRVEHGISDAGLRASARRTMYNLLRGGPPSRYVPL